MEVAVGFSGEAGSPGLLRIVYEEHSRGRK